MLASVFLMLSSSQVLAESSDQSTSVHTHNYNHSFIEQSNSDPDKKEKAQKQTRELKRAIADYKNADKSNKVKHLYQVIALAEERQALLDELVHTDPSAAHGVAIDQEFRSNMPVAVRSMLEEKAELEGELEVIYEDYDKEGKHRLRHLLKTNNGRVELQVTDKSKQKAYKSGMKVRARGWKFSNSGEALDSLVLHDTQDSLTVLADGTTSSQSSGTAASVLDNTFGEQRTLVVMVNFQDNTQQPWTTNEVRDMVFGTVNDFYKENSSNETWLSGDVLGYYTLPISSTCDYWQIHTNAQDAVQNDGFDTSGYSRMIYVYPENSSCGWTGAGTIGGSPSTSYINGSLSLRTVGHELGHNFGLHHAKNLECGSEIIGNNCTSIEYGDALDIMGKSGITGHFNAFNKEQLGWLTSGSGEIVTADAEGSYLLEPYESDHAGAAKGLKVRKGTDSATGEPTWYYIEYRQALGFDSFIDGKTGITDGVVFHLVTESDLNSSQMLDMSPASSLWDLDDAALLAGDSYTDADAGVTITTEWANTTGASVYVSFTGQSCAPGNPALSLTQSGSAGVEAGTTVSYTATVTNNDSSGCTDSVYDLSASVPAGWVSNDVSVTLAPGTSSTVILDITSAQETSDGNYSIAVNAANAADNSYSDSASVNYLVENPIAECVLASPVLSVSSSQSGAVEPGSEVGYTATVTSRDSATCGNAVLDLAAGVPSGWVADSPTVTLAPGATASVNLNVTSATDATAGVYNINVNAFNTADISYNSSAVIAYSVEETAPACVASSPTISVSSGQGDVAAGSTVNYSVTVTNRDSAECSDSDFMVDANVPSGWSSTNDIVTLSPGESSTVVLSVTSAGNAEDGTYSVQVTARNVADSTKASSKAVSYVIVTQANNAPVAVNDTVTLSAKQPLLIDVLSNDIDPDGDSLTIISVTQGAKGSVQITSDGQLYYSPAKSFKSTDSFSYTISDGTNTSTAQVSLSLQSSGDSGGSSPNKGKGKNK